MDDLKLVSSGGRFQLDPSAAWRKCSAFQLQDSSEAVCFLLRSFIILGATSLTVSLEHKKIEVSAANLEDFPDLEWLGDPVGWALGHEECPSRFFAMAFLAFQHYGATGISFLCAAQQVELWGEPVKPTKVQRGLRFQVDWQPPSRVPEPFDTQLIETLFHGSLCPIRIHCKIKPRRIIGIAGRLLGPFLTPVHRADQSPQESFNPPTDSAPVLDICDNNSSTDEPSFAVDFFKGLATWELPMGRKLGTQPNLCRMVPQFVRWAPADLMERAAGVFYSNLGRRKAVSLAYRARLFPLDAFDGCLFMAHQNGSSLNPKLIRALPPMCIDAASENLATDLTGRSLVIDERFHRYFCNLVERLASRLPEVIQDFKLFKGKPQLGIYLNDPVSQKAKLRRGSYAFAAGTLASIVLGNPLPILAGFCLGFSEQAGSPYLPFNRKQYLYLEGQRKNQIPLLEEYLEKLTAWLAKTKEEQFECMHLHRD